MIKLYLSGWFQCLRSKFSITKKKQLNQFWIAKEKNLALSDLKTLLTSLNNASAILERVDQIEFATLTRTNGELFCILACGQTTELEHWEQGRGFSTDCEIFWKKTTDSNYMITLISDRPQLIPDFLSGNRRIGFSERKFPVFLWGRRESEGSEWREERIPRPLFYPAGTADSPRVIVKEYHRVYWDEDILKEEKFYRFVQLGE